MMASRIDHKMYDDTATIQGVVYNRLFLIGEDGIYIDEMAISYPSWYKYNDCKVLFLTFQSKI